MHTETLHSLETLPAAQWNSLLRSDYPFLRHEFLATLERCGCVGEHVGWIPHHVLCRDESGQLLGALPAYIKSHYLGEFVFDHAWEAAYQRCGLPYYPKLVCAIPWTPATGPRLLVAKQADAEAVTSALLGHLRREANQLSLSSLHCLFSDIEDQSRFLGQGLVERCDCHFFWDNRGFSDFADFLAALSSKKRKNIRRERQAVAAAGIQVEVCSGSTLRESDWATMHSFYCRTFEKRWGIPVLSLEFFCELGRQFGDQVLLFLARDEHGTARGGSLCLRDRHTLYGRYWGCTEPEIDNLHFETCYYQGIEYCIEHGLKGFDPGVQGLHKLSRGFLPVLTRSAHWLREPRLHEAVTHFLQRETPMIQAKAQQLQQHSPYRNSPQTCPD